MANRLPEFPMEIIEHVQSFMNFKEAARSACVCKNLYNSRLRIRRIDFDQRLFVSSLLFWVGALRTMQQYVDMAIRIDAVTVRMFSGKYESGSCLSLLESAASLGATEINVIVLDGEVAVHLPRAMFIPNRLEKLSLVGGSLYVGEELPLICSSIKSVILHPRRYAGLKGVLLNEFITKCPSLETLEVSGTMLWSQYNRPVRIVHNLDSLIVDGLTFQEHDYFSNIISMFPCLKSLTLINIKKFRRLELSSGTLEELIINDRYRAVCALIKIPRLRIFRFEGSANSRFIFDSPTNGWTSYINLVCFRADDSWLSNVHSFLCHMMHSTIYLDVKLEFCTPTPKIQCSVRKGKVPVERLSVLSAHPGTNLMKGLRRVCSPRMVYTPTQY